MMRCATFCTVSSMLMAVCGLAEVHKVPADHQTIQAAIDASADGDLVLVLCRW